MTVTTDKHQAELLAERDTLLDALRRVMALDCPLTGNPSHESLVEFWEYEKSQGNGEADDRLFALAAIAKAEGVAGRSAPVAPAAPTVDQGIAIMRAASDAGCTLTVNDGVMSTATAFAMGWRAALAAPKPHD